MCPLGSENSLLTELEAVYTANEIGAQPELWVKIYQQILTDRDRIFSYFNNALPQIDKIVLTGAGTSAFIGLSLKGTYKR
jgi:tagatose-6-phosphate ketose/aldose isomerase